MITVEAAIKDLDVIEKDAIQGEKAIIRAFKVLLKFISTMRSNQLLTEADKNAIKEKREKTTKK